MKKLAIANFSVTLAMLLMIAFSELGMKEIFGAKINIYWTLLDAAVLVVSFLSGVFLWRPAKKA